MASPYPATLSDTTRFRQDWEDRDSGTDGTNTTNPNVAGATTGGLADWMNKVSEDILALETAMGTSRTATGASGDVNPLNDEGPRDLALATWTFHPNHIGGNSTNAVTLVPYLHKVYFDKAVTLSNMYISVGASGATLTAGSNEAGVYTSAGVLKGRTATQATAWTTTGWKAMALTNVAGQNLTFSAGTWGWLAFVSGGTTRPGFSRGNTGSSTNDYNGLLSAANLRWATLAAVTTGSGLPNTFTPSTGLTASLLAPAWMAAA